MSLRHALLGLLADHSASGYDLLKLFDTSLSNVWPATQSQIYTELNRLADGGLIAVTAEGPRGRKQYSLTDEGRAELVHWMTRTKPQRNWRSELLLRVFFLGAITREEARDYLVHLTGLFADDAEALRELDRTIDWDGDDLYGKIAMEYGLRFNDMCLQWAEWAVDQLAKPR
jgi:PadR family transcriptional regulator, regulatory protein AphA